MSVLRAFGDGTIFGESYGEGPLQVIWLHGWARTRSDFAAAATLLAETGVGSLALDLPGFGASPPPLEAGGARHYADLLELVLSGLADEPLTLVGHSFGGRVATVVAARRPDLVRSLVLTGVPLLAREGARRSPLAYRMIRAARRRGLISETRLEAARQRYGSRDYRAATGVMREVLVASVTEDYADELCRVKAPSELLWGANDTEVPVDVARRSLALLTNAAHSHLEVLEGVGHMLPLEAPADLAAAVGRSVGS